jgi:hypothetical protein
MRSQDYQLTGDVGREQSSKRKKTDHVHRASCRIAPNQCRKPLNLRKSVLVLAALLATSLQLSHGAEPRTLIGRPDPDSGPTQVSVDIFFVDINSIDSAQQTFTADIAVVLRWKDTRRAHTGSGVVHYPLDQIWNPRVIIVNETNSVNRRLPESAYVDADGTVLYRQRYVGALGLLGLVTFRRQLLRGQP